MKDYATLKALIEQRGVHEQLGPVGKGWGIEQNPHELATFLVRMQELGVQSVLEIGTGYKAGLARFLAHDMGWAVTTVDINDYGHSFMGIEFVVLLPHDALVWTGDDNSPFSDMSIQLKGNRFDLVFIDGAHDYDSVKVDYETYAYCATKAIAFHDIAGLRECEGAYKFWLEMSEEFPNADYQFIMNVAEMSPQQAGIGWIEL